MPEDDQYEGDEYREDDYQDDEDEKYRPAPVTNETLKEIDEMSPSELEGLLSNITDLQHWEYLRDRARERTAQWLSAIRKADAAQRCKFVKFNGTTCGSPAMKGETTCYFHGEARAKREAEAAAKSMKMPALEDRLSLQVAIMRICGQLADKSLDERTGRAIISALRLAYRNLGPEASLR